MLSDKTSRYLPLKADVLQILLSLEDGERHGYAMLKEIESNTAGEMRLAPSPFYRKLKKLADDGLVAEAAERPAADLDDERRRYYELTALGREVLRAEATRLVGLASQQRILRLAGEAP